LAVLAPIGLLHIYLRMYEAIRTRPYSKNARDRSNRIFGARWLFLLHPDDEALKGLRTLPAVNFPIFNPNFIVGPLSALTVLIAPAVIVLISLSTPKPDWSFLPRNTELGFVMFVLALVGFNLASFSIIGALFVYVIRRLSIVASSAISRYLDGVTWYQVRQSAFGNDLIGEIAESASDRPNETETGHASLPRELSEELTRFADTAAAQSISKLRGAVQLLTFSEGGRKKSDLLAEYLTWEELIHTAYFKVPRFRKLVCYAIAHSPGFRPSEKFKGDRDYERCGRWLAEIQNGPATPQSTLPVQ
jgi:hypothetical protein